MTSPIISPWYRRVLIALAVITFGVGGLAVDAQREAASAACKGANEAKVAVHDILHDLYAQTQQPTDDPGIAAARAQNAARYEKKLSHYDTILQEQDC